MFPSCFWWTIKFRHKDKTDNLAAGKLLKWCARAQSSKHYMEYRYFAIPCIVVSLYDIYSFYHIGNLNSQNKTIKSQKMRRHWRMEPILHPELKIYRTFHARAIYLEIWDMMQRASILLLCGTNILDNFNLNKNAIFDREN